MEKKLMNLVARKMPKVLRKKDFLGHDHECGVAHDIELDEEFTLEVTDYE